MSKNSNKGNVLINSLMTLILASIILTSITTTSVSSFAQQNEIFNWQSDLNEARNKTQVSIIGFEDDFNNGEIYVDINYLQILYSNTEDSTEKGVILELSNLVPWWKDTIDYNLENYDLYLTAMIIGEENCTYTRYSGYHVDSENSNHFPIVCMENDVSVTTEIIINEDTTSLFDFVAGTNGPLHLNGTSYIAGKVYADQMYISNHTLNGDTAFSLDSIQSLLPEPSEYTQYNFPYFHLATQIGTDIYTGVINGCSADQSTPCYSRDSSTIFTAPNSFNDVTNSMTNYVHEYNNSNVPIIDSSMQITLPDFDLNSKVNEIIDKLMGKNNIMPPKDYSSYYDIYDINYPIDYDFNNSRNILCYTNANKCAVNERKTLWYSDSQVIGITNNVTKKYKDATDDNTFNLSESNYKPFVDTVFANDTNKVNVNSAVTNLSSAENEVLFIVGDLIIDGDRSELEIGGTIIVTGDVIITGEIEKLSFTGVLYSFGTININLNSSNLGLSNVLDTGEEDKTGFIFAKEHIIVKAERDNYGADNPNINMYGYFYAEGSILIENDTYGSLNLSGGLYSKAVKQAGGINYPPLKMADKYNNEYTFDYNGIIINSYSGDINTSNESDLKNPINSRTVLTTHKSNIDSSLHQYPSELFQASGESTYLFSYKELPQ